MAFLEEYTLLCELGKGGFATVYKVRHNELGYIRAVRVLNDTIQNKSDKAYQNFLRECKLLLVLGNGNHRGIVHIYKPDFLDNRAIVEMDYVDGQDLLHYLADNKYFLPIDEVIRMVSEMSSALAYCHVDIYKFRMDRDADGLRPDPMDGSKLLIDEATRQKLIDKYKVIHNDIHSRNIMRRENGDFVLLDFGLAIEGDEVGVSSSRRNAGALEYISPEKWDDSSVLTTQSDIYSFGVVMYEYLTGRVPFKMEKNSYTAQTKLLEKVMGQPVPSIFEMRKASYESKFPDKFYTKDYPDWLETAILKCLEKEPDNRFHDGKELYDFVHDHIEEDRQSAGLNKELEKERDSLKNENEKLIKQVAEIEIKNNELDERIKTLNEELPLSSDSDLMPENEQDEDNNGVKDTGSKKKDNHNGLWIGLGIGVAAVVLVVIIALTAIFKYPYKCPSEDSVDCAPQTGTMNGHEWVDLGLPSGIKWATCNLGASSPEEYGDYYAWGETTTKETYTSDTYRYYDGSNFTKYITKYTSSDNLNTLEASDDAATANWGKGWRMPTEEDFQELKDKCTWTWMSNGYKVTGPNGNDIFLPAAGHRSGSELYYEGSNGAYWSSSLESDFPYNVCSLNFYSGNYFMSWYDLLDGQSVRPVYDINVAVNSAAATSNAVSASTEEQDEATKQTVSDARSNTLNGHEFVDLGLSVCWATCNVGASTPTAYGNYYAWGETTTKETYSSSTYTYSDNPTTLPSSADAATANWGKGWRMPTKSEFNELIDKCTWTWMSNGYKVTGPNGNGIFLPAAGYRSGSELYTAGSYGSYWSSSLSSDSTDSAWYLFFDSDYCIMYGSDRDDGLTVRAVCQSQN